MMAALAGLWPYGAGLAARRGRERYEFARALTGANAMYANDSGAWHDPHTWQTSAGAAIGRIPTRRDDVVLWGDGITMQTWHGVEARGIHAGSEGNARGVTWMVRGHNVDSYGPIIVRGGALNTTWVQPGAGTWTIRDNVTIGDTADNANYVRWGDNSGNADFYTWGGEERPSMIYRGNCTYTFQLTDDGNDDAANGMLYYARATRICEDVTLTLDKGPNVTGTDAIYHMLPGGWMVLEAGATLTNDTQEDCHMVADGRNYLTFGAGTTWECPAWFGMDLSGGSDMTIGFDPSPCTWSLKGVAGKNIMMGVHHMLLAPEDIGDVATWRLDGDWTVATLATSMQLVIGHKNNPESAGDGSGVLDLNGYDMVWGDGDYATQVILGDDLWEGGRIVFGDGGSLTIVRGSLTVKDHNDVGNDLCLDMSAGNATLTLDRSTLAIQSATPTSSVVSYGDNSLMVFSGTTGGYKIQVATESLAHLPNVTISGTAANPIEIEDSITIDGTLTVAGNSAFTVEQGLTVTITEPYTIIRSGTGNAKLWGEDAGAWTLDCDSAALNPVNGFDFKWCAFSQDGGVNLTATGSTNSGNNTNITF